MYMMATGYLPGVNVEIRNLSEDTIEDLMYQYHDVKEQKVGKLKKYSKRSFLISTTNLHDDYDLHFYLKDNPTISFLFPKAVKKPTCDTAYIYLFYKIVKQEGKYVIEEDEERKYEFYHE